MKRLINDVIYTYKKTHNEKEYVKKSISVYGLDTEALKDGKCFMIGLSSGDVFKAGDFPACLFSRKYINKHFVAYNLSYDEGALLQWLGKDILKELWTEKKVEFNGYKVQCIPKKYLCIRRGSHCITIWDMMNFFPGGLDKNAKTYLDDKKKNIETKTFTLSYVNKHWNEIASYCIHDAVLVQRLAELLIKTCEEFGVYPKKLYSTAYISFDYFKKYTKYPTVDKLWYTDRKLLDYAMQSYNGGKFEVTTKGTGDFWEYDIVSAYPAQIRNLVDITDCHVVWNKHYDNAAVYSFLDCEMFIPASVCSPIAVEQNGVNVYPCGHIRKIITKTEYEFLIKYNAEIQVIEAVHIFVKKKTYPFRKHIDMLVEYKKRYKKEGNKFKYLLTKIIMNSLYGKMIQFIPRGGKWCVGQSWNPIYASVITANTRCIVSEMQNTYCQIWAVHTDSIISTEKLPVALSDNVGGWTLETSGKGLILGSGIYQIGDIVKFRGFRSRKDLWELCNTKRSTRSVTITKAISWREVCFHNWSPDLINRFVTTQRKLKIDFDRKRLWQDDYRYFCDIFDRNVSSLPVFF